jgi:hypothetical protein
VRQFVAVYPLLAMLAWSGLGGLLRDTEREHGAGRRLHRAAAAVVLATLALGLWRSHPHELSYYNAFIRGVGGAETAGLELCYYLECVDPPFVRALDRHLEAGTRVSMVPYWPELLHTYQRHGLLRSDFTLQPVEAGEPDLLVYIRRRATIDDTTYRALPALHETLYEGVSLAKLVRPAE